jgi:hypothetical protein
MNFLTLKSIIVDLIDDADQEGCTPDLAVVNAADLLRLAEAAGLEAPAHICTDPDDEEVG